MIVILLLALIYFAFISLGLPDSLLGVSWPVMQQEWSMELDAAGLIALLITGSTITSALLSGHIIHRFGTGKVTFISCLMTGLALLGFSFSPNYYWLLVLSVPLGLGAGSVDTALNNYVALHFKAHHMNWLHSFWGVGATLGPIIMATTLSNGLNWRIGYRTIAFIQLSLAFLLFISLPLWSRHIKLTEEKNKKDLVTQPSLTESKNNIKTNPFRIKGVIYAILIFLFYCTIETSIGLWGSSYLTKSKGVSVETAALWIALYYGGITIGRFVSGFISFKLNNDQMIKLGMTIAVVGSVLLALPLPNILLIFPLMLIGLGLAPIFPAMIHETPVRFGRKNSQHIIGYQMAFGYIGIAVLPPVMGVIINLTTTNLLPFFWIASAVLMVLSYVKLKTVLASQVTD